MKLVRKWSLSTIQELVLLFLYVQEYAEAKLYETWLTQRRLHTIQELEIVDTVST